MGLSTWDARGIVLERFAAALELQSENVSSASAFAVGDRSSVIDVPFARLPRESSIVDWWV